MSDLVLGSTTVLSDSSGTPTIQSGVAFPGPNTGGDGGHIIQIKHQFYDTLTVNTGTTVVNYTDTGITATIRPRSASNKIFIMYNVEGIVAYVNQYHKEPDFKLLRGSTDLQEHTNIIFKGGSNLFIPTTGEQAGFSSMYLDNPSSTSDVTYKIQMKAGTSGSGGKVGINAYGGQSSAKGGGGSSILLMEVVG